MIAISAPYAYRRSLRPTTRLVLGRKLRRFIVFMSKVKNDDKSSPAKDPSTWEERFRDYLDGYFLSFDFYPVCERHLFVKNDAYALLRDFWAIGVDLNKATKEFIASPEKVLAGSSVDADDLKRRKVQTAQKAIEAILNERSKRADEDAD